MRLPDKVAIITGAGSGIGREAALIFAREGARVVVADMNEDAGAQTVEDITSAGGAATFVSTNVAQAASVEAMVQEAEGRFGKLDVRDLVMNVNLKGVFLGCKYAIPAMQRAGGGSIINVASFVALIGAATPQIAYTASKGGVLSMTREIAVEFARQNIRANALCPGPVATPLLQSILSDPVKLQRRLVHIPPGRFAQPTEIANAALYLASDESSYVNGSTFVVDGGITAAYVTPE
jgi:NAD(P)-dependent dehydrogenase (short-subunit alcohol dehydrogenase family)